MKQSREHVEAAAANVYRHATEHLGRGRDTTTCDALSRHGVVVIDAELERLKADGAGIACASGCNFCCHLRVGIFAHEAIALLNHLRTALARGEAAATEERILENARRIDDLSVAQHNAARIPCAFLVAGRCSVYDVRPLACVRYHSLSRARCEFSYEHPHDIGTPRNSRPALVDLQAFGAAVDSATEAALERAELSAAKAELHQLLRSLMEDPSAAERWLCGGRLAAAAASAVPL
jgi:Fe-S-cluster containining protein